MKPSIRPSVLSALVLALALSGCESSSTPVNTADPVASIDPACAKPFSKTINPTRLTGGRHFYFSPSDLSFLSDPGYQIVSVDLKTNLRGKYRGDTFEVPMDINGLQATPASGKPFFELLRYVDNDDHSEVRHRLDQLAVNGGMSLRGFMVQAKEQKGEIRISLQGTALFALNGTIEVSGFYSGDCPAPKPSSSPSPGPTPIPTVSATPVAPVTRIFSTDPATSPTASQSIAFSFDADQINVNFYCSLDGAAAELCTSPQLYSNLSNGPHSFTVYAQNAAGLQDATGGSYAWFVDSIAPSTSITNLGSLPALSNSQAVSFQFAADDPAASFFCALDGATALPCSSPQAYENLAEGSHQFQVYAVDSLGNVGTPASFPWTIDVTPPQAYIVQATPAAQITNQSTMDLQFTATEISNFECSLDHGAFAPCTSPADYTGLPQGLHQVELRPTDLAGNAGISAFYSWTIDWTPPVITLGNVIPQAGSTSNATLISVEFSANEASTFACAFDGAAATPCSSPFTGPVLTDGNHELSISAVDQAGNISNPTILDWVTDTQAPTLSFGAIQPSAASYINTQWISAEVIASESVTLSCSLDSVAVGTVSSPVRLDSLSEGPHEMQVSGTDLAGNASVPISHSFVVDLTPPTVQLSSGVGAITNQTSNSFVFTASEPASFECNLNGIGFSSCTSPVQISGLADGDHLFEVRATDLAGNVGPVASVSWTVDLSPPVVTLTVIRNSNDGIQFQFTANESDAAYQCSLDGAAFSSCSSPIGYSGLAVGNHNFTVRASDASGNMDPSGASAAWTVDPQVTTQITSMLPASNYTNQQSASFFFSTNVGVKFVCALDGGATADCASGVTYSGLAEGGHSFAVYAIDRWGIQDPVGASTTWTVDLTPPSVLSISHSYTRSSVTINWTTNEPATTQVNWGVGTDTSRVIADNGVYSTSHTMTISGLASNTQYSYIVGGKDRAGNAYQYTRRSFRTNP